MMTNKRLEEMKQFLDYTTANGPSGVASKLKLLGALRDAIAEIEELQRRIDVMLPLVAHTPFKRRLTYTVQPGDTLSEIARKTGTIVGDAYGGALVIAAANRIANPGHIEPGWELIIPPVTEVES